jgi:hypothetical protein
MSEHTRRRARGGSGGSRGDVAAAQVPHARRVSCCAGVMFVRRFRYNLEASKVLERRRRALLFAITLVSTRDLPN